MFSLLLAQVPPPLEVHNGYEMWVAIVFLLANVVATVLSYLKARDAAKLGAQNAGAIETVHVNVNNRLSQLLASKDAESVARIAQARSEGSADPAVHVARALLETASDTASALKVAATILPVDTKVALRAATMLRDTASTAAANLLARVNPDITKDAGTVARAAAIASDLVATAAQIAAALQAKAVVTAAALPAPSPEVPFVPPHPEVP